MAWQDDIKRPFIVQVPNGDIFTIKYWRDASETRTWHSETFSFINTFGQLVQKELRENRTFPVEFFFQGDDHITETERFLKAIEGKQPLIIEHPLYGRIIGQIISITRFNPFEAQNTTRISFTLLETIGDPPKFLQQDPVEVIQLTAVQVTDLASQELTIKPTGAEVAQLKEQMRKNKAYAIDIIKVPEEVQVYNNAFNEALNALDAVTASPIVAMQAMCNILTAPSKFLVSVQARMQVLLNSFQALVDTIRGTFSPAKKQLFQIQASALLSAMGVTAVTPQPGDYTTASSAVTVSNQIQEANNTYTQELSKMQVSTGSSSVYFTISFPVQNSLSYLVSLTISNLVQIALNGKREYVVFLSEPANVITLAHKYYGTDSAGTLLDYFCKTNDVKIDEYWQMPAGRRVVYYR